MIQIEHKEALLNSIRYIEKNSHLLITTEDIAKNAGYSLFYFSRIFKKQMGLTVMEYVKERRLIKASEEIACGKKIIDVALKCGYQSHSGFTKAFKNKFGFSPLLLRAFQLQMNFKDEHSNMDHVFMKSTTVHTKKEALYQKLLTQLQEKQLEYDLSKVETAYQYARQSHEGQYWRTGDDYIIHPLNVAILLAELGASEDAIIAGLLHDVILKGSTISLNEIEKNFSKKISKLILQGMQFSKSVHITDEDVILIKICDRLHNLRTIEFGNEDFRKQKAEQTLDRFSAFASTANKEKALAELTDLAIRYI